jgi:hypothetical protein
VLALEDGLAAGGVVGEGDHVWAGRGVGDGADDQGDVGAGCEVEFRVVAFELRGRMGAEMLHGGGLIVDRW